MKSKAFIYFINGLLFVIAAASCRKQVEVGVPITNISNASVFNSDSKATAAQLNLYAQMHSDSYEYHLYTGSSSDEYTNFSAISTWINIYKNSVSAKDGNIIDVWSTTYTYLYRVNAILEGIQNSTGMSDKVKRQLKGEALFMRAYWYFHLANFYGEVPLVISTDYKVNSAMPRTPQAQIYQQMVQDIHQAESLLSDKYVDVSDTAVTLERIRPTRWAAAALLARVCLYTENWKGADSAASAVISNPAYQLSPLTGANSIFMKNSTEAIWQITPWNGLSKYATPDGYNTILSAPPGASSSNCVTVSTQLLNAFEPGDNRKTSWIGAYSNGSNTWYFPYKYKDGAAATVLKEYTMILRLAEQYLIRAEARVWQENLQGAVEDLNIIRKRAGLADYTGPTDKNSLLAAVLRERQVELFSEGHRWFDLRRTGNLNAVMGTPGNATTAKGGLGWAQYQQYYPIPSDDILTNPDLLQTPGY